MRFGVVLELDPPASRTVDTACVAEQHGFDHVWLYDTPVRWQEPFVLMGQVLDRTERVRVGPFVTNPVTRDPALIASTFATLNDLFGNRTVCGIGRGDSALRTQGRPAGTLAGLRDAIGVVRELGNGRAVTVGGADLQLPWAGASRLEIWVAAYGPRALALAGSAADGVILQLADPEILPGMIATVRAAAVAAGRDPADITVCVGAPAHLGTDRQRMLDANRWFGGLAGNHLAAVAARGGLGTLPPVVADYLAAFDGYRYDKHADAAQVPDEIVERFCLLGTPNEHIARLRELRAIGVDHFAAYLQHADALATLQGYGEQVIPASA